MRKTLLALTMGLLMITMTAPFGSAATITAEDPDYEAEGHLDFGLELLGVYDSCRQWGECAAYEGDTSIAVADVSDSMDEYREAIESGIGSEIKYEVNRQDTTRKLTDWNLCFYDADYALLDCDRGGALMWGQVPWDTDHIRLIFYSVADADYIVDFGVV